MENMRYDHKDEAKMATRRKPTGSLQTVHCVYKATRPYLGPGRYF